MNKKGLIITNAFSYRESAKYQCESLIKEFASLGVILEHKTNEEVLAFVGNDKIEEKISLNEYDFVIYLDKDKYVSLMLSKLHFKLFNSHESIDICDDKMMTHIFLSNNGIKMPKTLSYPLCYEYNNSSNYLNGIKSELKFPFIVKENYGSLGQQVYLVENDEQLIDLENKLRYKPHIYQEFIKESAGVDYRLILIGNEVVASMKRVNNLSFKANIAQGGKGYGFVPSEKMQKDAIIASKILNLDYCAIDFVVNENDEPFIIEVNSNAYFTEIEKVTGINVARKYANYIYKKIYLMKEK